MARGAKPIISVLSMRRGPARTDRVAAFPFHPCVSDYGRTSFAQPIGPFRFCQPVPPSYTRSLIRRWFSLTCCGRRLSLKGVSDHPMNAGRILCGFVADRRKGDDQASVMAAQFVAAGANANQFLIGVEPHRTSRGRHGAFFRPERGIRSAISSGPVNLAGGSKGNSGSLAVPLSL